jgi:hypothetical protein
MKELKKKLFLFLFSEESDDNVAIAVEQDIVMDIVP